jgi:hypothetical protein
MDSAVLVGDLHRACPRLTILITSREALAHLDEALAVCDRLGNPWWRARILGNLGLCELFPGAPDRARRSFAAQLALSVAHGYRYDVGEPLAGLGAIAAHEANDEVAAHLIGASATAGYPPGELDRVIADRLDRDCYAAARTRMGAAAWSRARSAGARWAQAYATAYALESAACGACPQAACPGGSRRGSRPHAMSRPGIPGRRPPASRARAWVA